MLIDKCIKEYWCIKLQSLSQMQKEGKNLPSMAIAQFLLS